MMSGFCTKSPSLPHSQCQTYFIQNKTLPLQHREGPRVDSVDTVQHCKTALHSSSNQGWQSPGGVAGGAGGALLQEVTWRHVLVQHHDFRVVAELGSKLTNQRRLSTTLVVQRYEDFEFFKQSMVNWWKHGHAYNFLSEFHFKQYSL